MWFLTECEHSKLQMMFFCRSDIYTKIGRNDQNAMNYNIRPQPSYFYVKYSCWGHSFLGELFDGTVSRTEPRTKVKNITNPLKVNIQNMIRLTIQHLKPIWKMIFVPKYGIIYCYCACNFGIAFMSKIDALNILLLALRSSNYLCYLFERCASLFIIKLFLGLTI